MPLQQFLRVRLARNDFMNESKPKRRNGHSGRNRHSGIGATARKVNKESDHRRPSDVVSRLRRFRGARLVLQGPRETQSRARKDRHPRRDRLFIAFSVFRQRPRRALHSRPRRPTRVSGISLARPDLHVFLFGGDGDGFSIGGNHLDHGARKNINMTYFIMDNFVYGLTKKQTSPTSPIGFKIEDGSHRRDRSTGQSDEETDLRRRNVHRAHARRERGSHDSTDRARDGSPGLQRHRMLERMRRIFSRTYSIRPIRRRAAASK